MMMMMRQYEYIEFVVPDISHFTLKNKQKILRIFIKSDEGGWTLNF